jgi:hypothetical protein
VYYFVHSAIEFIFTPGGEAPGLGRGATMSHADARAVFARHGEDITGLDEAARSKAFRRIAFSIHPDRRPASEKDEATRDLVELNAAQAALNMPQASGSSFTSDRPRRRRSAREPWAPANRVAEDGPAWTRSKPHPSTTVWQNEGAPIPDSAVRAWARELLEHSFVRVQSREYTPHDPRGFWTNYGSAGYFGRTFSTRTLKKDEADEGWVVAAVYQAIKNSARKWEDATDKRLDPADLIMRLTVQAPIGQNVGHAAIAWQAPHGTVARDFGYSTRYYSISFAPRPVRKKRIPKAQRLDRYRVESMLRAAGMKVTNPRAWKVTKWRFPDGARTLETKDRTFGSSHYGQITAADVEKDIEWARQDPRAGGRGARNVEGIPFTRAGQDSYLGIIAGRDVVAVKRRRGHWRWAVHDWPITVRFPTILGRGTSMKSAVADAVQAAATADPRGPWGPNWGSGRAARATGKKRGAILFSGGMDSVILASIAKERGYDLIPFYMSHRANVGNVTKKEIVAASKLARTVLGRKLVIFKPPTKKTPKWYSELGLVFESDKLPVLKGDKDHRNRTFIDILHDEGMADEVVALGLFGSTRVDGKERTKARADDIIPARLSEYLKSIGGSGTILSLAEYDGPGGEAGAKERALTDLPASAKRHVLASESCLMWFGKPCGDCWSCMDRVKSITAAWGKDTTPYRAESKADKHKKGGKGRRSRGRAAREPGDMPFGQPGDIPIRKALDIATINNTNGSGTPEVWARMDVWVAAQGLRAVIATVKRVYAYNGTPWSTDAENWWLTQLLPEDKRSKGRGARDHRMFLSVAERLRHCDELTDAELQDAALYAVTYAEPQPRMPISRECLEARRHLQATKGNKLKAARLMGVARSSFYRLLARC